jgi:hypothetical protein
MSSRKEKLNKLCYLEGLDIEEILRQGVFDGICPAICMNEGCDETYEYEPDSTEGWCEACGTNSVKSALILAGMI